LFPLTETDPLYSDVPLYFYRSNGETMNLVIERNGEQIALNDFPLKLRDFEQDGQTVSRYGLIFSMKEAGPGDRVREAF
jgi:hypothetical protein